MIKKYFTPIFCILFISIFTVLFWSEYKDFYNSHHELQHLNKQVETKIQKFQTSDIQVLEDTLFFYTPDQQVLNEILTRIDSAEKRVFIEVYILTETSIKKSLLKAQKRGINVKVILERNPYRAANINNKTFDFLEKHKIDVIWSHSQNYSLNHTKLLLIDDEAIISTWNLSHSTFKYNRDFFIFTRDKKILFSLEQIFHADFNWIKQFIYHPSLVVSPNYSRKKLTILLESATKDIKLYFQYFEDDQLEKLLLKKIWEWVKVSAIISKSSWKNDKDEIMKLQEKWIEITALQKEKMHAKMILIDNKNLYLWSINFSTYSIDSNREIWILMKNEEIITSLLKIFKQDIK